MNNRFWMELKRTNNRSGVNERAVLFVWKESVP